MNCRRNYDRIVLRTPFLNEVRDSIPILRYCDLSLLVTMADKTRTLHLKKMESLLRRFQIEDLYAILVKGETQGVNLYTP